MDPTKLVKSPMGAVQPASNIASENLKVVSSSEFPWSSSPPDVSGYGLASLATLLGITVAVRRDPTTVRIGIERRQSWQFGTIANNSKDFEPRVATQPIQVVVSRKKGMRLFLNKDLIWKLPLRPLLDREPIISKQSS